MAKVSIYTTPTCGYCKAAKAFFQQHNIDYTEYNVARDSAKAQEVVERTHQMGVPVIDVDGELVIGFDQEKLANLLGIK